MLIRLLIQTQADSSLIFCFHVQCISYRHIVIRELYTYVIVTFYLCSYHLNVQQVIPIAKLMGRIKFLLKVVFTCCFHVYILCRGAEYFVLGLMGHVFHLQNGLWS